MVEPQTDCLEITGGPILHHISLCRMYSSTVEVNGEWCHSISYYLHMYDT